MGHITTTGIEMDDEFQHRILLAAQRIGRTPDWLIRQAVTDYLRNLENDQTSPDFCPGADNLNDVKTTSRDRTLPFISFAEKIQPQSLKRAAITTHWRSPETEIIPVILEHGRLPPDIAPQVQQFASVLASNLRFQKNKMGRANMVQGLLQEFSLSTQEGVALMCLAEALLRIPDKSTRDALIRDKISSGNWHSHLGNSPSLFVNAATWGLLFTGRLVALHSETTLSNSLNRIIVRSGEPIIRKGVDMAMRLLGEQFVSGETINQALTNAHKMEAKGFRYSYDMLGEAALTAEDAKAYLLSYQQAIHAIGVAAKGKGIYEGPGISIKLSALHPRYSRAQYRRVIEELYPVLLSLTLLARSYDIGLNIDAEESDRLELSLDLLEKLCLEPQLQGWNGIGFVIQAYQKRCPYVIDYLTELAIRSKHRLMIRLVKGAYWDSEIKLAQVYGLEDYPVYTRKVYTDIAYIACAKKLLKAPNMFFPQFATHNAHTLAAIYYLAGQNYYHGQYEFQCLHGMGEPLYEQLASLVGKNKLERPCRIYAPVGTYKTLLAYLVRRLLENGANSSFVNRIADKSLPLDELTADPATVIDKLTQNEGQPGLPNPKIPLPRALYGGQRLNSSGLDLASEQQLTSLANNLLSSITTQWQAAPLLTVTASITTPIPVTNPANRMDVVGQVVYTSDADISPAVEAAVRSHADWSVIPAKDRATLLERAAMLMEEEMQLLMSLLIREAGKTYANAVAEVREAVDFLRYYAAQIKMDFRNKTHRSLGPVVCISPWNFPLAIFTGQIAAALAAGNSVLAKPAEQTSLIAAAGVRILLRAGIPQGALQLLPGPGETTGAQLIADERIRGVMFTGSTAVASLINKTLARRRTPKGQTITLIAETGGINAMIVDSSALTEQVVIDICTSAFDSAGQRCSALRLLCLQDNIADHTLKMLRGAMSEYRVGDPQHLATDIGPVIDDEAKAVIMRHINAMRDRGYNVFQAMTESSQLSDESTQGHFVAPTLIELDNVTSLTEEIFGPVLHVVRFNRNSLSSLIDQINASGYGLTMGIHTRIGEVVAQVARDAHAGNLYVNRNIVGAVVGTQPFGGEGLSGTGPKAGGPLYLYRLLADRPENAILTSLNHLRQSPQPAQSLHNRLQEPHRALTEWARGREPLLSTICQQFAQLSPAGEQWMLPGPTGEENSYLLLPRKRILCIADNQQDALIQLAAVISVGSHALWPNDDMHSQLLAALPAEVQAKIHCIASPLTSDSAFDVLIFHGKAESLCAICEAVASRPGPVIPVYRFAHGETDLPLERLLLERSLSINSAAAGGNASLISES